MLKVLSKIITAVVLAAEELPNEIVFSVGLAKESTRKTIINTRSSKRSHCLSFIRRIFVFCNSFKKARVLNSIVLSLRKFRKCSTIGIAAANKPNNTAGFRNVICFA
jgi:hypothetical protein